MKRKTAVKNSRAQNKRIKVIAGFVAFVLVFTYLFVIRPAQAIQSDLKKVQAKGTELKESFKSNELSPFEKPKRSAYGAIAVIPSWPAIMV